MCLSVPMCVSVCMYMRVCVHVGGNPLGYLVLI